MTVAFSNVNDLSALAESAVTITGGTLHTGSTKSGMFSPYGFVRTEIDPTGATVTVTIDLPALAARDALAVWHNVDWGDLEIQLWDTAGPTMTESWAQNLPAFFFVEGQLVTTYRKPTAAFDQIKLIFTPTTGADISPLTIHRVWLASDALEIKCNSLPHVQPLVTMQADSDGISQTRARPLGVGVRDSFNWNQLSFADVCKVLEFYRLSDYGACPLVYLEAFDEPTTNPVFGPHAACGLLRDPEWSAVHDGADVWQMSAGFDSIPHDTYPLPQPTI